MTQSHDNVDSDNDDDDDDDYKTSVERIRRNRPHTCYSNSREAKRGGSGGGSVTHRSSVRLTLSVADTVKKSQSQQCQKVRRESKQEARTIRGCVVDGSNRRFS